MTEKADKKRRRGRKTDGVAPEDSVESYQPHKTPLIQLDEDAPTWHEYGKNLPGRNDTITTDPPGPTDQSNRNFVAKCRSIGDMILQQEMKLVGKGSSADERWVENTMRKGTLKDRIAAMSVTVSSDPVHKFYALDGLLAMVGCSESGGKTNSRVAQLTAEALDDLFLNTFLPADRKLLTLAQRPLYRFEASKNGKKSKKTLSPRILLLWRFEEIVKEKYELYLTKYMGQTLQEGADMQKTSILQSAGNLLSSVPEGESLLLSMMVNKLGDPGKKTASAAGHQLRLVLQKHPNMQLIVAREVQQLAHRPHLSPRALYNCIVFLNQLKLTKDGDNDENELAKFQREPLAASLIKTYFRLFEVAVKGKKDKDPQSEGAHMKSRLLSALLTGVNRAHPYLPEKNKDMEEHVDALYRVVHTAAPTACTQALMLLFNLAVGSIAVDDDEPERKDTEDESSALSLRRDRFYRALYATLSKPSLVSQGKHLTMYFNLLYKAMKYDTESNRVIAFAKRLMCTVIHCTPPPIAGSVFLLSEIAKIHAGLRTCMEEVPMESDSMAYLDETKRDPRSALAVKKDDGGDGDDNISSEGERRLMSLCPPSWELSLVAHHFHPSVKRFALTLGSIDYAGDPLKDFGLGPFLDKFAYRNPKSQDKLASHFKRGESIAERRSCADDMMKARLQLPMNDPAFLEREQVNEEDEFFRRYFVERARRDEIKGITRGVTKTEMDEEELGDAENGAMDAAEEAEGLDAGKSFEEYERAWESDPEEEAFVDSLALKLLEDSADGPVDVDDDPDMEDWGDMYADEKHDMVGRFSDPKDMHAHDNGSDEESDDDEGMEVESNDGIDDDDDESVEQVQEDDAFMDADDDSDESAGSQRGESLDDLLIQKGRESEQYIASEDEGNSSSDDQDDLVFAEDPDEIDSGDEEAQPRKKARESDELPTFADADAYAAMVNENYEALLNKSKLESQTLGDGKQMKSPKKGKKNRKGKA